MSGTVTEPAVQVDQWLSSFEDALARGDAAAASELFLDDSYWRDLVALTWNLKTVEGPEGVKDMLEATLAQRPSRAASPPPSRRPRPTASPTPGSSSRRRPAAATACCGSRTARRGRC